ncbi:SDR family oxidoreductase (plasmid) [Rhizobium bangladeshense]|uniref:SDR family NAD(P)-dependent oxidoreductase n=1 Tax=Rhizobium bangladeshense TaxID=1138189 RepID=UPI001A9869E3|nr:SDR family oxidoreductase [Rhizobium bangladeshense]QSY97886.1 SDR family oxidoreductase [Rhizobium bangladeshense]
MKGLSGKTAVITGAASGIGRATALRLAAEGATVIAVDRESAPLDALRRECHGHFVSVVGDIGNEAITEKIEAAIESGETVDILINCAARGGGKLAEQTSERELSEFLDVNVVAQFRLCRFAISRMAHGGVIVNVGSMFGETGASAMPAYSISKSAVSGMTRQLATDYGPKGIRVVAVAPGLIETPRTEERMKSDRWLTHNLVGRSALRRAGTAAEVASAIAFLASDEAAYITGIVIPVDGGWSVAGLPRENV